jgi:hypothetical protein
MRRSIARALLVGFACQHLLYASPVSPPWPTVALEPWTYLTNPVVSLGCLLIALPAPARNVDVSAVGKTVRNFGDQLVLVGLGAGYVALATIGFSTVAFWLLQLLALPSLPSSTVVFVVIGFALGVGCLLIAIPAPDEMHAGSNLPPAYVFAGIYVALAGTVVSLASPLVTP